MWRVESVGVHSAYGSDGHAKSSSARELDIIALQRTPSGWARVHWRSHAVTNPLSNWRLDPADITTTGHDLRRPECVLAERNGTLFAAVLRGGVLQINADSTQRVLAPAHGGGPLAAEPFVPGTIPD